MAFDANDLSPHEHFVLERVRAGEIADFTVASPGAKAPVRAGFLRKLLLGLDESWSVAAPGVRIKGARIEGALDLTDCAGEGLPALMLEDCDLPEPVDISHARIGRLSFRGSRLVLLVGVEAQIDGQFDLRGISSFDEDGTLMLRLHGIAVAGDFAAHGAQLARPADASEHALSMESAAIEGAVWLGSGFEAHGCVWLLGAQIKGSLECGGGRFFNRAEDANGSALVAENATIGGDVFLRGGFVAEGEVWLAGAQIRGDVDLDTATLRNDGGVALSLVNAEVGGQVTAEGAKIAGYVNAQGVRIGRNLDLRGSEIVARASPRGDKFGLAFEATGANIGGAALFQGVNIKGEVLLADARIEGYLAFGGGRFINPSGWAIRAPNVRVGGNLTLKIDEGGYAPHGGKTVIEGGAKFHRARIDGALSWLNLELRGQGPDGAKAAVFSFADAAIDGPLQARALSAQLDALLDVSGASCAALDDEVKGGWGADGARLALDGFTYERIDSPDERWRSRLAWLKRSRPSVGRFSPQPFAQAASVYAAAGRHEDARRIQLARFDLHTRSGQSGLLTRLLSSLFGLIAGYGLAPIRVVRALVLFIAIGVAGVFIANEQGALVTPAGAQCNGAIEPTLYALDVATPLIDLGQEGRCAPGRTARAALPEGAALGQGDWRVFEGVALWRWAHGLYALLGAILTALAVLTFSGVMKPRDE
jgi:hypothetical protein